MRKRLVLILSMVACLSASAQRSLTLDGEVVAHGIGRMGAVPPALQELVGARRMTVVDQPPGTPHRSRARRRGDIAAGASAVGPLLSSIRDQETPYNLFCPYWIYDDGRVSENRCLSGCVATAIEQILAYYRYPEALIDTLHGWQTDHYTLDDMLPGTRFDWDHYLLDYRDGWTQQQGEAIALVSLAAGMAVHMTYGLNASGANTYLATEPLHRAFGYGMAEYRERILYTPSRWHAMLRYELEHARPVVYTGHNMDIGGHAFNIDGVDADGYYHVNWGYNGSYDGWYDLDWLSPFDPTDFSTTQGYVIGFFCNQSALFMHPSADARPLEPDTLDLDGLGVELERVELSRQPDVQGRIAADFYFASHGTDSVTYTYEVMTWLPTDTAIFYQADYVGLAGLTLAPGERRVQRTYLRFSVTGERILGISHDDVTIPFTMPVTVVAGTRGRLEWGDVTATLSADGLSVTFSTPVTNRATDGYASDLVTYCLYADGYEAQDTRHYEVLSLPAGQTTEVSMTFHDLLPATHYTMLLRCPWAVQRQTEFTTPPNTAVRAVEDGRPKTLTRPSVWYDTAGRMAAPLGASAATTRHGGFRIQGGKKFILCPKR